MNFCLLFPDKTDKLVFFFYSQDLVVLLLVFSPLFFPPSLPLVTEAPGRFDI